MHHDPLHIHVLLRAVVLAQVVISNHHTEGHLTGAREGSPEQSRGLKPSLSPLEKSWEIILFFSLGQEPILSVLGRGRMKDRRR